MASYAERIPKELPMSRPLEALAEEVLQLPTEARSRLLDKVVASLDADRARDAAWDALAAKRDAEIEAGTSVVIPGPAVLARLRAELESAIRFIAAPSKTPPTPFASTGGKQATALPGGSCKSSSE
jgi:Putative addiction module component